jgi:hypothetical protein
MIRISVFLVLVATAFGLTLEPVSLNARPEFLAKFQSDPFRRQSVDGCGTCHIDPKGGGTRNEFGAAFAEANHVITPIMRANYPNLFGFYTTRLPDGSTFYFSDPENKYAVFEKNNRKVLIDIAALTEEEKKEDVLPPAANRMTFFVTSAGGGSGGHLEGLAGADRHCQELATAAGAGDRIWRAYLSTSFQDKPAINAGDRIGEGPWYNAKGVRIARGVVELHKNNRLNRETALDEKGQPVTGAIMTGTLPDGTAAIGQNCNNWTSSTQGTAVLADLDSSWNSGGQSKGCSAQDLGPAGGGLFYCFAKQ